MTAEGWRIRRVGDFAVRSKVINVEGTQLPPLSITKGRGVVLQSEKYKKQIATDLRKYVIARRDQFAFDPMSLYYGAIGQVVSIDVGLVSPDYVVFDVDNTVDKRFLHFLLRSPEQVAVYETVAETGNSFGKRRRVYWSVLEQLELRLPPLGEQRQIAAVLSSIDDAIEATQAVIAQLQIVQKALLSELLTRGLPGRHARFKQTEIGEIPERWDVAALGDALDGIDSGWSPMCEGRPATAQEWGVLKLSAVTSGAYLDSENKALPADLEARPDVEVYPGDVLLARASGVLDLVGKTVLVRSTRSRLMLSDKVLRLRPKADRLQAPFLSVAMTSDAVRSRLLAMTGGSHMRNVSQTSLRELVLPIPPPDEQLQISSILDSVEVRIRREQDALAQMVTAGRALMSALLSGEVRVTPDEVAA